MDEKKVSPRGKTQSLSIGKSSTQDCVEIKGQKARAGKNY